MEITKHQRELGLWVLALVLGVLIPSKILSLGYSPSDDALCHVAKAISGKPWSQILVLQDGYVNDEHPGWHAVLGALYKVLHCKPDILLGVSVLSLFVGFWLALVAWRKRPEAALVAIAIAGLACPANFDRLLLGRPFIVIVISFVLLLQMWSFKPKLSFKDMALTTVILGLSVWIHGSWYLFGIMVAGFAFAQQKLKTLQLAFCWIAGTLLGATLTGDPITYLQETTTHLFGVFGGHLQQHMLVSELQCDSGDIAFALVFAGFVVLRVARGAWSKIQLQNPIFIIAILGWVLGLQVSRFWSDWGLPAAIIWIACEVEELLLQRKDKEASISIILTGFICLFTYVSLTRDIQERWSRNLTTEYVSADNPHLIGWLPDKGGIVYNSSMLAFFKTFYANPTADWRYMVGFEPGIMPMEDQQILRQIQFYNSADFAYKPWVDKMKQADRMMLLQDTQPTVPGLEWQYAAKATWIGRLPRVTK